MAWPNDYIEGSARVLPVSYNTSILGIDYTLIQDWIDAKVIGQDLVTNGAGEVLLVPAGYEHSETTSGTGLEINPSNDSADYFAAIICEDPADKAKLQITNNTNGGDYNSVLCFALRKNSCMYDVKVGINCSSVVSSIEMIQLFNYAKVVGVTNNDILISEATIERGGIVIFHVADNDSRIISSGVDISKTFNIGSNMVAGVVSAASRTGYLDNCTFTGLEYALVVQTEGTLNLRNVILQDNNLGNIMNDGTGVVNTTTCAIDQNINLDTDGYTLLEEDGQGTNLSAEFTDDINGELFTVDSWDRGADVYQGDANTAPNQPTNVSPVDGASLSSATLVTITGDFTDDDGDDLTVTIKDNSDDSTIATVSVNGGSGSISETWGGLASGSSYGFYFEIDDGTDTTQSSIYSFTINSEPSVVGNPTPRNGSKVNFAKTINLSVTVSDVEGDKMTVIFKNASDSSVIGTVRNASSNDTVTVGWSGLYFQNNYSWFVEISDGTNTYTSSTYTFHVKKPVERLDTFQLSNSELPDAGIKISNNVMEKQGLSSSSDYTKKKKTFMFKDKTSYIEELTKDDSKGKGVSSRGVSKVYIPYHRGSTRIKNRFPVPGNYDFGEK